MLFLIVEYPDKTFGTAFTAKRPGVTFDSISEPPVGPPGNRRHQALALAQGLNADDMKILVTGLAHLYDDLETVQQDLRRGRWMGRFTVRDVVLRGTGIHVILGFQERFGALWTHAADGIVHLRARVNDPQHGEELVQDMREALRVHGMDPQIEVRELGPHDYGTWDELVQASVGLAS